MKTKNFFGVFLVVSAAIFITACYKNKNAYNSPNANSYTITMKNSNFSPASLAVTTGSKIIWTNDDNTVHTVTATDGSFNSGDIAVGSSYTKTFSSAGTFNYHDDHNTNMTGVLIITGSAGGY